MRDLLSKLTLRCWCHSTFNRGVCSRPLDHRRSSDADYKDWRNL